VRPPSSHGPKAATKSGGERTVAGAPRPRTAPAPTRGARAPPALASVLHFWPADRADACPTGILIENALIKMPLESLTR